MLTLFLIVSKASLQVDGIRNGQSVSQSVSQMHSDVCDRLSRIIGADSCQFANSPGRGGAATVTKHCMRPSTPTHRPELVSKGGPTQVHCWGDGWGRNDEDDFKRTIYIWDSQLSACLVSPPLTSIQICTRNVVVASSSVAVASELERNANQFANWG